MYDTVVDAGTVTARYETASTGNLTTDGKRFSQPVNVSALRLEGVSSTRATEVNVTVESDPDADGTYEESSATISLDGSDTYEVAGLSTESERFRLVLEFESPAVTASPSFDSVTLRPAG